MKLTGVDPFDLFLGLLMVFVIYIFVIFLTYSSYFITCGWIKVELNTPDILLDIHPHNQRVHSFFAVYLLSEGSWTGTCLFSCVCVCVCLRACVCVIHQLGGW